MQTGEVFETFCFTVCWQGLRDNCSTGGRSSRSHAAAGIHTADHDEDMDEDEAAPAGAGSDQGNLAAVQAALCAAPAACTNVGLASKTEALQTAFEQCSSIQRMALAHESKGASKKSADAASMGVRSHCTQMQWQAAGY